MIFRAMVDTPDNWHERTPQCVVFVEGANREDAAKRLRETLAPLWRVKPESLDWENMQSETDLINTPMDDGAVGDHRLFVTGAWRCKPIYLDGFSPSGTPLFLLTTQLERVMRAFLSLPRE